MKILMTGHYSLDSYPRGKILHDRLKAFGVNVDVFSGKGRLKYLKIAERILRDDYDLLIVTGITAFFVSRIFSRKPIIFDAFISNYDTLVHDRKIVPENSFKARILWFTDKYSCKLADKVMVDTVEHMRYFVDEFSIDSKKFSVVLIGTDTSLFYPQEGKKKKEKLNVSFWGSYIPLQGVEYIIKAAKLLEKEDDVEFNLLGSGQTWAEMNDLASNLNIKNIRFHPWVHYHKLPLYIAEADVCLGIFGITAKAKRVIPNKVYEAVAMKKPLITGNTPAIRRFFRDGENCLLCEVGNPEALAEAIMELKKNPRLMEEIANHPPHIDCDAEQFLHNYYLQTSIVD